MAGELYNNNDPFGLNQQNNNFGIPMDYFNSGSAVSAPSGINFSAFGGTNPSGMQQQSAFTGGVNALAGLGNLALGYKQYGLAKDDLAFQKEQANINNQNQMTTLNNLMAAQADNRRIATGGASPTGEEYVASHGIRV